MRIDVKMPIFFIGMPRSGTTVIFEAFASHKELGWLSNYSYRMPWFPYITVIHRLFGKNRGKKNQIKKLPIYERVLPEPSEMYNVWNRFFGKKFGGSFLLETLPPKKQVIKCRDYIEQALWSQGKKRFCAKFTGPPRMLFLSGVFPDAQFVDVVRDPRAVVFSLMRVDWWRKRGQDKPFWEGALVEEQLAIWDRYKRSSAALAALQWRSVYERTLFEKSRSGVSYCKMRYEDFLTSPVHTVKKILEFTGLPGCKRIEQYISSQKYDNMNYKYRKTLSESDIKTIEEITEPYIGELGYV